MPRGIEVSSNTTRVREAFAAYAAANKRDRERLFRDQAKKLAVELYKQTAAVAPSAAEIESKVQSLGWAIPAYFGGVVRDGKGHIIGGAPGSRIGRGTVRQWVGVEWERRTAPKRKRGRPTKRAQQAYNKKMDAFFDDYLNRPSLEQMQRFVVLMRTQARLYLASGWLGAVVDLGGSVQGSSGKVERERGGATISVADGVMSVLIWNRSVGIEDVNGQKGFVEKAIALRIEDMGVYVARKEKEAAQRLKRVT